MAKRNTHRQEFTALVTTPLQQKLLLRLAQFRYTNRSIMFVWLHKLRDSSYIISCV